MGPGLREEDLLQEEPAGLQRGLGSSEKAEPGARFRLRIVTSQLCCILSTATCHRLRFSFHTA